MNIHFKTFGCKVNQCESGEMIGAVLAAGCRVTGSPVRADIIVINSCTVTSNADNKAKQYLRKCLRLNPKAKYFLTGCYVDRAEKELREEFCKPAVCSDIGFFGNLQKQNISKVLGLTAPAARRLPPPAFNNRTRAFVKIQDGCDGSCSYCAVPGVRPELRSKNIDDVISEVKKYVLTGCKEVVLCGIRLGKYGFKTKTENRNLTDLIKELEKIDGLCRIRLSSIELNDITDGLLELMADSKKICRHLHIPLQSGDGGILKDMNRPYTADKFFEKILKIRKKIPDIGITTDIIIGYPEDTAATLENSYDFVKKCEFSRLHVFKFSARPGTKAALKNKTCPPPVVKNWQEQFKQLDLYLRENFLKKFKGKKMEVLAESNGFGYTSNYIRVKLPKKYSENTIVIYEK